MDNLWYKNAIIYAVDVDRFSDSDGNGVGDFEGLAGRIDYLADLGVTCLWMLPFFPAPNRDNGYDIKNYYDIDPALGSIDSFVGFLHKAGERGIRVVLDLVMNHTSNEHPWFQAARRDKESFYHDFYTWSDAPPPTPPGKGTIFPGEETSVWTYDEIAGSYYYHRFYHFQPDLNTRNPHVVDEIKKVLDFWLSFGISGFRVDAASHMIEPDGKAGENEKLRHGLLKSIRERVSSRNASAVLIGEADVQPEELVAYFGDGDELTLLFNFMLNNYLYLAFTREDARPVIEALRQLPAIPENCQWANFLRNLDEVDLERLTDQERQEVFESMAPKEDMRIFDRGIRRRLAPMLNNDRPRMEMAFSLLFALPGAPALIYGDEIGMGEDLSQKGRYAVRSPMQWSAGKNAGFSTAAKKNLVQPVIESGDFGYKQVNVEAQRNDPSSFWHWVKRMIFLRRSCDEIGRGAWSIHEAAPSSILAMRSSWKDGIVMTVHNLAGKAQKFDLNLHDQRGRHLLNLLTNEQIMLNEAKFSVSIEPYGYQWYRVVGERMAMGSE